MTTWHVWVGTNPIGEDTFVFAAPATTARADGKPLTDPLVTGSFPNAFPDATLTHAGTVEAGDTADAALVDALTPLIPADAAGVDGHGVTIHSFAA